MCGKSSTNTISTLVPILVLVILVLVLLLIGLVLLVPGPDDNIAGSQQTGLTCPACTLVVLIVLLVLEYYY